MKITPVFRQMADAAISQANPVSGAYYEVLPTTKNVRIISINAIINWAVTQPTPLNIRVTIDGQVFTYKMDNPVTATNYYCWPRPAQASTLMDMLGTESSHSAFLLEGRSIRVAVAITWAVTQPTPLECRVKYARL